MLEEMGEHDSCEFCQRTAGLDVDKLQADMDATTATLRLYADDDDLRTKWPETSLEADDNQE